MAHKREILSKPLHVITQQQMAHQVFKSHTIGRIFFAQIPEFKTEIQHIGKTCRNIVDVWQRISRQRRIGRTGKLFEPERFVTIEERLLQQINKTRPWLMFRK